MTAEFDDIRRNQLIADATKQMLDYILDERKENSELPDVKQITVMSERDGSWIVWAIMNDGKTYKYAWYITSWGDIIADGF
jgi:hypothetical protein